jgi:hypothetical protein
MSTLALGVDERVASVEITEDEITVRLMDGRTISAPLVWYPRLLNATAEQRKNWSISGGGYGIHWEDIDEDLSTRGLLLGVPASQYSASGTRAFQARKYLSSEHSETNPDSSGGQDTAGVYPKGVLDYLVQVENAGNKIGSILSEIKVQFIEGTDKIQLHGANIVSGMSLPAGIAPSDINSVALLLASDMTELSNGVEESTQRFNRNMDSLEKSYLGYISLLKVQGRGNKEHLGRIKESLPLILNTAQELISTIMLIKGIVQAFRDQGFSSALTEAADRVLKALNGLQEGINELESFPLRVLFQIDEN